MNRMKDIRFVDNLGRQIPFNWTSSNKIEICVEKNNVPTNTQWVQFEIPSFAQKAGSKGYYVVADADSRGSHLCYFTDKPDYDNTIKQNLMPIVGVKTDKETYLLVVTGMQFAFYLNIGIQDGLHYLFPRFVLNGDVPYEDIRMEIYRLGEQADYSDIAGKYRQLQLERGNCVPLKQRCENNPILDYTADSIEIRIRLGWKPAPATVLYQTPENEPEMKVACTFFRVRDLIDKMKAQGIEKAQICLVGWNKSGHDGRYPDLFPVEEKLGGEEELRSLIRYAQQHGFQIICHTNSTDCYSISEDFSENIVIREKDQSLCVNELPWSGGRMYKLCPHYAMEYAKRDLPKVAELGFRGTHYVDVMSVLPPMTCYSPEHPSNAKETAQVYLEIMKMCHDLFGGFSSEGCLDFAAKYLDYGLYTVFSFDADSYFDQPIPFWQLVYHGIILSNACTDTVNYTIKGEFSTKRVKEFGSRPSFYLYSKHLEGSNQDDWLGHDDLIMDTDEQLDYAVMKIREGYDDFQKVKHLQKEFMIKHEMLSEKKRRITYSDGTVVEFE